MAYTNAEKACKALAPNAELATLSTQVRPDHKEIKRLLRSDPTTTPTVWVNARILPTANCLKIPTRSECWVWITGDEDEIQMVDNDLTVFPFLNFDGYATAASTLVLKKEMTGSVGFSLEQPAMPLRYICDLDP